MKDKILNTICILSAVFLLWVCLSWVDIITDNMKPEPQHSNINFFVAFTELWEDRK